MTSYNMQYFTTPRLIAIIVIMVVAVFYGGVVTSVFADSQATFTFKNTTGQQTNDLHIEFNTSVDVTGKGPFTNITDNNTSKPTLSGGTVANGASAQISVTGQAGKTNIKKWWWTIDGRQVGNTYKGCKAPECTSP